MSDTSGPNVGRYLSAMDDDETVRFRMANERPQSIDIDGDSTIEDEEQPPNTLQDVVRAEIIRAAAEAATMAVFTAIGSGVLRQPYSTSDSPQPTGTNGNGLPDENQSARQSFQRPPGKCRVPRPNETKLVDEAMRDFLTQKGVHAKNFHPELPSAEAVEAYEEHGLMGPDPDAPRVCLTQTFGGKWNKAVVDMLTTQFISAVEMGKYKPVDHTWSQMQRDVVQARCKTKLYSMQHKYITRTGGPEFDKLNRMYSRRQETYHRRRKICEANHQGDEAWESVKFLLDALGTRGMSDDETDDESARRDPRNHDRRFKKLRRIDTGFLTSEMGMIWAAVETYPSSTKLSRGNRPYNRDSKHKSVSKNRMPIPGLPANFYNPKWLEGTTDTFRSTLKEDVALPVLVPYHIFRSQNSERAS